MPSKQKVASSNLAGGVIITLRELPKDISVLKDFLINQTKKKQRNKFSCEIIWWDIPFKDIVWYVIKYQADTKEVTFYDISINGYFTYFPPEDINQFIKHVRWYREYGGFSSAVLALIVLFLAKEMEYDKEK